MVGEKPGTSPYPMLHASSDLANLSSSVPVQQHLRTMVDRPTSTRSQSLAVSLCLCLFIFYVYLLSFEYLIRREQKYQEKLALKKAQRRAEESTKDKADRKMKAKQDGTAAHFG